MTTIQKSKLSCVCGSHCIFTNLIQTTHSIKNQRLQNIIPERNHLLKETPQILSSRSRRRRRESLRISFDILMASTSISATGFKGGLCCSLHGNSGNSILGEDYNILAKSVPTHVRVGKPVRSNPMMKNVNEGKGLFAPIVVATRNIIGKKRFNQLRGKAIALHSQVITEFCKSIGADAKQRQGLIRLAKKNGERLGFLA